MCLPDSPAVLVRDITILVIRCLVVDSTIGRKHGVLPPDDKHDNEYDPPHMAAIESIRT